MSVQSQHGVSSVSPDCCYKLTRPTVTNAEPVFQPTSENWLESQ